LDVGSGPRVGRERTVCGAGDPEGGEPRVGNVACAVFGVRSDVASAPAIDPAGGCVAARGVAGTAAAGGCMAGAVAAGACSETGGPASEVSDEVLAGDGLSGATGGGDAP
jgi:hypothetical protein